MRCKIIEIGPMDACLKHKDDYLWKAGVLDRNESYPDKWLSGNFIFDDPKTGYAGRMLFHQVRVEPLT